MLYSYCTAKIANEGEDTFDIGMIKVLKGNKLFSSIAGVWYCFIIVLVTNICMRPFNKWSSNFPTWIIVILRNAAAYSGEIECFL